ncbi:endoglucanase 4-like isoform X2 [Prosopis cineraria]|uniref:endoglucanase 4-like isoform X2 n=1 Tax=Prosopis cineraria TaxID=364024 RepID=UPI0024102C38|nr:endoglucanase 4-like isoform X2 [Prosopis cineraria]
MGMVMIAVGILLIMAVLMTQESMASENYGEALTKSILFFEGQRSGKLPSNQRITWRKDSALRDGFQIPHTLSPDHFLNTKVDLVGGYYDAGDNVKFNFPMAFSTTMLAWSVIEFGKFMGRSDLKYALDAVRWGTDYLMKATGVPGYVFAVVGDPNADHSCWERPEDMDTSRRAFAVGKNFPGSEVSGEISAALAASSIVFKKHNLGYSSRLLNRARMVFEFADKYRGSYNDSLGPWVCPFYCNLGGYQDELVWGAAWLFKATKLPKYWNYVNKNIHSLNNFGEFGWDTKDAGINVLISKFVINSPSANKPFIPNANKFVCAVLPESPTASVSYSPGGILFKGRGSNMQHATSYSFLFLVYASYLNESNSQINCGGDVVASPKRLVQFARGQVDYILGNNPLKMSYMVLWLEDLILEILTLILELTLLALNLPLTLMLLLWVLWLTSTHIHHPSYNIFYDSLFILVIYGRIYVCICIEKERGGGLMKLLKHHPYV